jgi:hypothetical protein
LHTQFACEEVDKIDFRSLSLSIFSLLSMDINNKNMVSVVYSDSSSLLRTPFRLNSLSLFYRPISFLENGRAFTVEAEKSNSKQHLERELLLFFNKTRREKKNN